MYPVDHLFALSNPVLASRFSKKRFQQPACHASLLFILFFRLHNVLHVLAVDDDKGTDGETGFFVDGVFKMGPLMHEAYNMCCQQLMRWLNNWQMIHLKTRYFCSYKRSHFFHPTR